MMGKQDFKNIDYLLEGNPRQRKAFAALKKLDILTFLKDFRPIVVGTIPIEVDIEGSDIDIICESNNLDEFDHLLKSSYGHYPRFRQRRKEFQSHDSSITSFIDGDFELEIFVQGCKSDEQRAYRHMIIEHRVLGLAGSKFRDEILEAKKYGKSTEEAFAEILGLEGDPYDELLKLENFKDRDILELLNERFKKAL